MKPTIKVSIGGIAFQLEENGYRLLENYLNRLQTHYAKFDGGREIVDDIELRIAELLRERICSTEQAISETIIKEVIAILGYPEEIDIGESATGFNNKENNLRKKMYRDINNKVLGGVCSGLAAYFNIDVVIVRVLFVVFFIGFSALNWITLGITGGLVALIYILLWIITPVASTVQQRYEMHGERPNLKNIQRKVEEELRNAGVSIKKNAPAANEVVQTLGKIIGIFFGSLAIIIAISILLAFVIALTTGFSVVNILFFNLIEYIDVSWQPEWFFGLLAALIFLPVIGLLYGGIKLLFCIKTNIRIGWLLFLLWFGALLTFIGMGIYHSTSFLHWRTAYDYIELSDMKHDTLYVDIAPTYYSEGILEPVTGQITYWDFYKHDFKDSKSHNKRNKCMNIRNKYINRCYSISDRDLLLIYKANEDATEIVLLMPKIEGYEFVDDENFSVEIQKVAAGSNPRNAFRHAKQVPFHFTLKDSLLLLEPLQYTTDSKWKGELLRLRFNVPEGKTIVWGEVFGE